MAGVFLMKELQIKLSPEMGLNQESQTITLWRASIHNGFKNREEAIFSPSVFVGFFFLLFFFGGGG